jgi:hypothetical protein
MKRFDPSGGISEGADAITRLDQAQPLVAMAQLSAAALGAANAPEPGAVASDKRKAHGASFKHSRSTRNTGCA